MNRLFDVLFARRDAASPTRMVGFPSDGGLVTAGVTGNTALGLSSVWRCLDILSNGVSQLDWQERRGNLELPSSRLVSRPQADRTRREWTSLVVSTLALYDVCYLLKAGGEDSEGVPVALWPLPPDAVQAVTADYSYGSILPPSEYWVGTTRVPASRLVILRRSPQPGVDDALGGLVRLARITFAAAIAAEAYASRYWQAGGSPNTVLETDANISNPTADSIQERWRERRSKGPDYAPVLSGGLKAKEWGADPTAASAVEARREMVADIGRYFGIGSSLLNSPNQSSETYSTTEAEGIHLLRFTLVNYIGAIEDAITDQLPGGRQMVMDVRPLTKGSALSMAQAYQLATANKAWMTPDEVREDIGLPPAESPDQLNPPAPEPVAVGGNGNGAGQGQDSGRQ